MALLLALAARSRAPRSRDRPRQGRFFVSGVVGWTSANCFSLLDRHWPSCRDARTSRDLARSGVCRFHTTSEARSPHPGDVPM